MNITQNKLSIAQLFATNEQFIVPSYQQVSMLGDIIKPWLYLTISICSETATGIYLE